MKQPLIIAPSLLSARMTHLGEEAKAVLAAGADWLHFDVMDNHFVPNLTLGAMFCQALREDGISAPIDVHLMVSDAKRLIEDFAKAGASSISIHIEAEHEPKPLLARIRALGLQAAIALNPKTPVEQVIPYLADIDMLLIMSVNPGFGGQSFMASSLEKLAQARQLIDESGHTIRLQVDGGINLDTIQQAYTAGADTFVAGSAIFNQNKDSETIRAFREVLGQ